MGIALLVCGCCWGGTGDAGTVSGLEYCQHLGSEPVVLLLGLTEIDNSCQLNILLYLQYTERAQSGAEGVING